MKLRESIQQLLHKQPDNREVFLSLLLDAGGIVVQAWAMGQKKTVESIAIVVRDTPQDSWEERIRMVDGAIVALEDKAGTLDIHKAILGLPATYLTEDGNIAESVREHIKKLTRELALKPLGFVSLHQALIHDLKKAEGVPPSAILLGLSHNKLIISLYKVGVLSGQKIVSYDSEIVAKIEIAFKSFVEIEVLPSRILLYGLNSNDLEELRGNLLRHPWPTRANFLHFPKIEVLTPQSVIAAVSLAGASELALALGEETEEVTPAAAAETPLEVKPEEGITYQEEEKEREMTMVADLEKAEMVEPEEFGFAQNKDVLEPAPAPPKVITTEEAGAPPIERPLPRTRKLAFPSLNLPALPKLPLALPKLSTARALPLVGVGLLFILFLGLIYWFIPRATVTIYETPQALEETTAVIVDPGATSVDQAGKVIPGKKQEKSVTGGKTIPVTGKKKVGDPAKGAVTIYNKVTTSRLFRKDTVISSGTLAFTLDSDVTVASASETIGSITFGKATVAVTASAIGTESNLPAGSEFTFKDFPATSVVARNEAAFAGGTSREVTVVSRADYDNLVKILTEELVNKAKQELATSVAGSEKLIDATIKTAVTEKSFGQELDQEAGAVEGKVTVTLSGISYNDDQLKDLLKTFIADSIPSGYSLVDNRTAVSVTNPVIKKDGKISLTGKFQGIALPILDVAVVKKEIAGKKLSQAQVYLQKISGIGAVEFNFRYWPWKSRLPINQKNISVTVAIQE